MLIGAVIAADIVIDGTGIRVCCSGTRDGFIDGAAFKRIGSIIDGFLSVGTIGGRAHAGCTARTVQRTAAAANGTVFGAFNFIVNFGTIDESRRIFTSEYLPIVKVHKSPNCSLRAI